MAKFPFGLDAYMLERHLDGNNEMQAAKPTTYGTCSFFKFLEKAAIVNDNHLFRVTGNQQYTTIVGAVKLNDYLI
jgi:hypothetical protein